VVVYLLSVALTGLVIGALARLVVPGRQPMGCIATTLYGIAGSIVGGIIGRILFGRPYVPGLLMSVLGAAVLIWVIYGTGRRRVS
jgi:uncharacterized membrane protein YeaQ/YmgE (transglycosylase-associated protein family)